MPKTPIQRGPMKAATPPSVMPPSKLVEPYALIQLNFRASAQLHWDFKLCAAQHGMPMVDQLLESFRLLRELQGE